MHTARHGALLLLLKKERQRQRSGETERQRHGEKQKDIHREKEGTHSEQQLPTGL